MYLTTRDRDLLKRLADAGEFDPAGTAEAVSAGTPAGTVSAPTFTGSPTSVVQPYIVVYMWKRTA